MVPQSLLFDRRKWTPAKAKAWAKSHGFRYGKVDTKGAYHRLRQFAPKKGGTSRTFTISARDGIKAVGWRGGTTRRRKRNPTLMVQNPRGKVFSKRVENVSYVLDEQTHDPDTGELIVRVHEFDPPARMEALPDGSIRIYHPKHRVWGDGYSVD